MSNCEECTDYSTTCNPCSPYYFNYANTKCLTSCPNGYFEDTSDTTNYMYSCVQCYSTCLTCSTYKSTGCLSCAVGRYLSSSYSCVTCPTGCSNCLNATYCYACSSSYLMCEHVCVSSCPIAYYKDSTNSLCISCYSKCKTCSGSLANQCLTCYSDHFLSSGSCIECEDILGMKKTPGYPLIC